MSVLVRSVCAMVLASAGWMSRAAAQQALPLADTPTAYTDVIDAFDEGDPLDVNVRAGFLRSSRSGTIRREVVDSTAAVPTTRRVAIAEHSRVVNTLQIGLDVGVYKDLALSITLPIVLRDSRELSYPSGRSQSNVDADLNDPVLDANGNLDPADQDPMLFHLPFAAPPRSGLPEVRLGLAWGVINQQRARDLPTWVLLAEARLATGDVQRACDQEAECAEAGISDGTSAIRLESRTSYRFRHLEPYVGFAVELPWVSTGTALYGSDLDGLVHRQPPRTAEVTIGAAMIPWEDRERFQRVSIDLRMSGAYISEGRTITPLFDALGTSRNRFLVEPNYDRLSPITGDPSSDPRVVSMTGVTDVSAHARIGVQAAAVIEAAKYIRFMLGLGLGYATAYMLTGTDACNPSVNAGEGDPRRGQCPTGIFNPAHRPVVDVAGRRFLLDGEVTFDLMSSATAQF